MEAGAPDEIDEIDDELAEIDDEIDEIDDEIDEIDDEADAEDEPLALYFLCAAPSSLHPLARPRPGFRPRTRLRVVSRVACGALAGRHRRHAPSGARRAVAARRGEL